MGFMYEFKNMLESLKPEGTIQTIHEMLEKGEIEPHHFSLKALRETCQEYETKNVREALTTDLFPRLTGELINTQVIKGYDAVEAIGERLVTEIPSKVYEEKLASLSAMQGPEAVPEGREYSESNWEEGDYVISDNVKYGRLLAISEESIYMDRTGEIMRRASRFGEKARVYKEKLILNGIQDVSGYRCWRPNGTLTDFYSTANENLNSSNVFGESGLETCQTAIHNMTDSEDDPILIGPNNAVCLVPIALWNDVNQMARSALVPEGTENSINVYKGTFTPMTSPFVTAQSTSTWYWGNFKRAFAWLSVWPLETLRQKPDTDYQFKRDISMVYKIRLFGSLTGLDPKFVQKNTA